MTSEPEKGQPSVHAIHMPAPTAWPFVLAIGVTLIFAGLVTAGAISVLGIVVALCASVGWFRNVFPHEQHEAVSVTTELVEIKSSREQVARLPVVGSHRTLLPVERFTVSAGVKGGLAGGIAMIAPATIFGLIQFHSLWYAPNLLAAMAISGWSDRSTAFLSSFHLEGLLVAVVVHLMASVLVGLLYGAILPMFPWEPIATAGFLAPIFWSGLLYAGLAAVNPHHERTDRLVMVHCFADCLWPGRRICRQSTCSRTHTAIPGKTLRRAGRIDFARHGRGSAGQGPQPMMAKLSRLGATMVVGMFLFAVQGCNHLPGKPGLRPETLRPDQTVDFHVLYKSNCSACHGDRGLGGPALPLNNPVYLAWAGKEQMLPIVSSGESLQSMHAFAQSGGGMLTDQQVGIIVDGMISNWGKPGVLDGANAPGYSATTAPDAAAGKASFQIHCASCHGEDGTGASAAGVAAKSKVSGSIVDPTYLSLISDRGLRDIVVAGLPGDGMPDWRGDGAVKPMTDKEVTDVVAWLGSHRVQFPGQPFPSAPVNDPENSTKGK